MAESCYRMREFNEQETVYQRSWHSHVRRQVEGLLVEAFYLDMEREYCARMQVHPLSFEVLTAQFEVYREPGREGCKTIEIPQMNGLEAYLGSGPKLRKALEDLDGGFANELFAEGVRAVVQAETFLWQERGFDSPLHYSRHFGEIFKNACRYYSFPERVTREWCDYAGTQRDGILFSRSKEQLLYGAGDELLLLGSLNDSFHGAVLRLELTGEEEKVKRVKGFLPRVPDEVCREAAAYAEALEGQKLAGMDKKKVAALMGKGEGCVHLIDLAGDALKTLALVKRK